MLILVLKRSGVILNNDAMFQRALLEGERFGEEVSRLTEQLSSQ